MYDTTISKTLVYQSQASEMAVGQKKTAPGNQKRNGFGFLFNVVFVGFSLTVGKK